MTPHDEPRRTRRAPLASGNGETTRSGGLSRRAFLGLGSACAAGMAALGCYQGLRTLNGDAPEPALHVADATEAPAGPAPDAPRVLVAYFSQADAVSEGMDAVTHATPFENNTQTAALAIAQELDAGVFQIQTQQSYPVIHTEASALAEVEQADDVRPALASDQSVAQGYDVLFLGFPIWWYSEPMAIRSFLDEVDTAGTVIAPFCTSLAVSVEEAAQHIAELCPDATVLPGLRMRTADAAIPEQARAWAAESLELARQTLASEGVASSSHDGARASSSASEGRGIVMRITVDGRSVDAVMEDNATTRDLLARLPLELPMLDLYNNEMCYRFEDELPVDDVRSQGYEVGDILYWPPRHSFVIRYAQNGEVFEFQRLGHVDAATAAELFGHGDATVTLEAL